VYISGTLYTLRDRSIIRLIKEIKGAKPICFPIERSFVYLAGPVVYEEGGKLKVLSCGPTTTRRMERYLAYLFSAGVDGIIGKGPGGGITEQACLRYQKVYLMSIGGAGVYLAECIKSIDIVGYSEFGLEAIYKMEVEDLPGIVGVDARGNNFLKRIEGEKEDLERTLVLIKPDALERKIVGKIINYIEEENLNIEELKRIRLGEEEASEFYRIHQNKPFFHSLIKYSASGDMVALLVSGRGAIGRMRKLIGATDPIDAEAGTIRYSLGIDKQHNSIHASENKEFAEEEIRRIFSKKERDSR
jgi:tartrate/fumarate subfamily iron-sulfur-dependent hydro-lyase beta chain